MKTTFALVILVLASSCGTLTHPLSSAAGLSIGNPSSLTPAIIQKGIEHADRAAALATTNHDARGEKCWVAKATAFRAFPQKDASIADCPDCIVEYLRLVKLWFHSSYIDDFAANCGLLATSGAGGSQ